MASICPRCDTWRTEEPHRVLARHGDCEGQVGQTWDEAQERRQAADEEEK